jgi:hypothetical protein
MGQRASFRPASHLSRSKVHPRDFSAARINAAVAASLRRLRTSYVDLVLLHYSGCWGNICDGDPPPEGARLASPRCATACCRASKHAAPLRVVGRCATACSLVQPLHARLSLAKITGASVVMGASSSEVAVRPNPMQATSARPGARWSS